MRATRARGWLVITAALTLATGSIAAGNEPVRQAAEAHAQPDVAPPPKAASHPILEGGSAVDGLSVYQLPMALTDQDGAALTLDHFRGQPTLISLFYASCPAACPLLIHDVQGIEAGLDPAARAQLRVLLVSIDPARDTPEALKAAAQKYKVDEDRWRLTRADDSQVRELAAVLGIKYRRGEDGTLGHTSRLTLLDAGGVPRVRQDGLGQPADALITEIQRLAAPAAEEAP